MNTNVGSTDKVIRIITGVAMLAYLWKGQGQLRWLGWPGVVLIATALVSLCPSYAARGIKTPTNTQP